MKSKKNIYLFIIIISAAVIVSILVYLLINKDKMYYDSCLDNFKKASYDATIYSCEKNDSNNENCKYVEYQYKNKIEAYKGENEYYKYINYKTDYMFVTTTENKFIPLAQKNTSKLERIMNLLKNATIEEVKGNEYILNVSNNYVSEFASAITEIKGVAYDEKETYHILLATENNNIKEIKIYPNNKKHNIRIIFNNINKIKNIEIPTT